MLARPTEASTSKTLSLGPHIFWTFKAPAVNCCEKYNQAWPFIILWENLDFDICSTGVSGLPKDSGKGCRFHSFNVRLWHPWLLAHVQWHLCAAKQWLWPMYMTNAVPLHYSNLSSPSSQEWTRSRHCTWRSPACPSSAQSARSRQSCRRTLTPLTRKDIDALQWEESGMLFRDSLHLSTRRWCIWTDRHCPPGLFRALCKTKVHIH